MSEIKERATELFRAEVELDQRLQELEQRRQELEGQTGSAILEAHLSGDGSDVLQQSRDLDREASGLSQAIDAAREKRREVIRESYREQAKVLRGQAVALCGEVKGRKDKINTVLDELERMEGVRYVPPQPPRGPSSVATHHGVSRTGQLLQQASRLEREAAKLCEQEPPSSGSVQGRTTEALLEMLRNYDPLVIGPRFSDVREWAASAIQRPPVKAQNLISAPGLRGWKPFLRLSWSGGEIDDHASGHFEDPVFGEAEAVA